MASEVYPLFRDYSLAVRNWLRGLFSLPRYERMTISIINIKINGTSGGGVNQHEIELMTSQHGFKPGHVITLNGSAYSDDYYTIEKVIDNVLVLDRRYRSLRRSEDFSSLPDEEKPTVKRAINVIYANMERAYAQIAQPLRDGLVDSPGVSFYISDQQFKVEKTRPKENYYTRHYKDNNTGVLTGVARVPPLLEYNLQYSINIWAVYQQELDILNYQIATEFVPDRWWWVGDNQYGFDYDGPREDREHKGQWAHGMLEAITDASDYDTGDIEDRSLRSEIIFSITNAYLPQPFNNDQSIVGSIDVETILDKRLVKPYCKQ